MKTDLIGVHVQLRHIYHLFINYTTNIKGHEACVLFKCCANIKFPDK